MLTRALGFAGLGIASSASLSFLKSSPTAQASDAGAHPAHHPWSHDGYYSGYDAKAIRRGYHVYKQVCATCHSMNRLAFRNLVGVAYSEDEMKEIAKDVEIQDGPDDQGNMFMRPGKLADYFPAPYANEKAARAGNNGALPPDLTVIAKARHGGEDYIFALLNGYSEPPAGVTLAEGQYYNAYMPGGKIAMAPPLFDGVVDYDDGTEASTSQVAKDVATFLAWSSMPELEERHKMGAKTLFVLGAWLVVNIWYKRFKWTVVKGRTFDFKSKI